MAIQLKPDYVAAYVNSGNAYAIKNEFDKAIANHTAAIQFNPVLTVAYYNRGNVHRKKGQVDMAIMDYTTVLQLEHDFAPAYYNRALAWLHKHEWEKAMADLTIASERGVDIIASFCSDYQSVADFEDKTSVKLPEDIAELLTEQEERPSVPPMKRNLFQSQIGIEQHPFAYDDVVMLPRENLYPRRAA